MAAVPKTFTTAKGTVLPLINLRGRPYLEIAQRFVWLDEKYERYTIDSRYLALEEDYAICEATVSLFNTEGELLRRATSVKKETKKDFPDFVEKVGTSAAGRALSQLGIGTQFCTQDMEEGKRLADAPASIPAKATTASKTASKAESPPRANIPTVKTTATPAAGGSFNKASSNGW